MSEIIIPPFIQHYLNAIHEPSATIQLVKLASDYNKEVETAHRTIQNTHSLMQEKLTGIKKPINLSDRLKNIEKDYKAKAKSIGKEHLSEEEVEEVEENIVKEEQEQMVSLTEENVESKNEERSKKIKIIASFDEKSGKWIQKKPSVEFKMIDKKEEKTEEKKTENKDISQLSEKEKQQKEKEEKAKLLLAEVQKANAKIEEKVPEKGNDEPKKDNLSIEEEKERKVQELMRKFEENKQQVLGQNV